MQRPTRQERPDPGGDAGQSERTGGCHRYSSAEISIGQAQALDLACSGAKTATSWNSFGEFKPGLDFYNDAAGNTGQALELQHFAASHRVRMVVVSIGGNDLGFTGIIATCVSKFMTSPWWAPSCCKDSTTVAKTFSAASRAAVAARIGTSLANVAKAMGSAGYAPGDYSLVVQNYVSPLPRSSHIAYSESGFSRQSTYGCGFWNADLDWAAGTAVPAINTTISAGIAASGVAGVRTLNVSDPNYWGQLALRNCLRQAYNGDDVRSGSCTAGTGLTSGGEPAVNLS